METDFRSTNHVLDTGLFLLICLATIFVTVPLAPTMPTLFNGEILATNQAVAQGLIFGKDYVFTYGPYVSIYAAGYHPATDRMMLCGSALLAVGFCLGLRVLTRKVAARWLFVYLLIIAGVVQSAEGVLQNRDALLLFYPFIATLAIFKAARDGDVDGLKYRIVLIGTLAAPFGLLPLIKGSMFILCLGLGVPTFVYLIYSRHPVWAVALAVVPACVLLVAWMACGQSLMDLPRYLQSMSSIVSGYSDAMAITGNPVEIVAYIAAVLLILVAIYRQEEFRRIDHGFLLLIFVVYFFLVFKAGFVRHDYHAIIAGTCLLLTAPFIPMIFKPKKFIGAMAVAVMAWLFIVSQYLDGLPSMFYRNIRQTYLASLPALIDRIIMPSDLKNKYEQAIAGLRNEAEFPILAGTSDIYSYDQPYLIASGNKWNPRPIFQSYSNYSPWLSDLNVAHISGDQAPDNIMFRLQAIDQRLESLEDGASWPIFFDKYFPQSVVGNYLLLRKRQILSAHVSSQSAVQNHAFNDIVDVPDSKGYVFASVDIRPTLLGNATRTLFKTPELVIILRLSDGRHVVSRIVPGMAKRGFVISPFVQNSVGIRDLYCGRVTQGLKVKSFSVFPAGGDYLWEPEFSVRTETASVPSIAGESALACAN